MNYKWQECELTGVMMPGYEDRQIEECVCIRFAPPTDVFCFTIVDSWKNRVWDFLHTFVTDEVKVDFVRNPPERCWSDVLSWLDDRILRVTSQECDSKQLTADFLSREFCFVRAAHGTRTNNLSQFYQDGLRCLRANEIEQCARSIFCNDPSRPVTEDQLQTAIDDFDARDPAGERQGYLYFAANEQCLVAPQGGAGHYLIYGSEYLFGLGIRIINRNDTKSILKQIGRPTMFICDVPIALMHRSTLLAFAGAVISHLFSELVEGLESDALNPVAGVDFRISDDLSARQIVGHYHPICVHDPNSN